MQGSGFRVWGLGCWVFGMIMLKIASGMLFRVVDGNCAETQLVFGCVARSFSTCAFARVNPLSRRSFRWLFRCAWTLPNIPTATWL